MKRSEAKTEYTWDLTPLYPDDASWEAESEKIVAFAKELASYKGKLASSGADLLEYLRRSEEYEDLVMRYYVYSMFKGDEDQSNSKYQGYVGKTHSVLNEVSAMLAFETPEIVSIPDETLERFYKETPGLDYYKRAIDRQRAYKPYTLSEPEEKLLAMSGEVCGVPTRVASVFRNADLKYPDITDSEGNVRKVTQASFVPLMESPDVNTRRAAFLSVYNTYEQFKGTMASLFDAQVKQLLFHTRARKFASNMERSLFRTEVPVSVYKNLISAVNDNMSSMHKFMRLRKKIMGVDELHMYDIYTPLVPEADVKITFEQAKELALKALSPLGEEYLSHIKEGFENRWIDVYENEGKRGGAYSCGTPVHPYVLLNHNDTLDAAFTLVHEMGHAMHSYLSNANQSPAYSNYVIFVAEVASTFNESLLMQYMLRTTQDKKQKAYLINHFLEQFRTTLYRQTMFAEFEMQMNEYVENGGSLTADVLCDMYYKLNKKYYGEDMVVDNEIKNEWMRIPHFFMNYYVYQYATGFSAAMALSDKVLKEGEPAVKKYIEFLSSGCRKDPISLLRDAGVDMNSPEPISQALKVFDSLIDELEALV
ncbi:MAG: oligoendopeptidase F [Clostridia bacterium]|nr:oligoendopeptidase F [Clostridia bacterium]